MSITISISEQRKIKDLFKSIDDLKVELQPFVEMYNSLEELKKSLTLITKVKP